MTAQHILPSGLKVVADPMPGRRTLAVTVSVTGGARWEDEARSGWSHLLEHLVFKGAGGRDARALIERIENAGGSLNADTGQERTSFHARVLEGDLELALSSLSDLMFRPTLDPVEIEREKDVVAQEIAEAFDTPDDCVFDLAQGQAFAGQPLGRPILGTNDSLKHADRAAVSDWRARLYAPERMVVSVSGAVDEAELLTLAERWFGEAPGGGGAASNRPISSSSSPAWPRPIRTRPRSPCWSKSSAAAWRPASSRRPGRSGAWPMRSTRDSRPSATPAW